MSSAAPVDSALLQLAQAAGLAPVWQDAYGRMREVKEPVLRSMLNTLCLPCNNARQIAESLSRLEHEGRLHTENMLIARANQPFAFSYAGPSAYILTLEDGRQYAGKAVSAGPGRVSIPGVEQPGYHQLNIGPLQLGLAVAPATCPSVEDITGRQATRAWGVAAQVYSLRRTQAAQNDSAGQVAQRSSMPSWPGWANGGDFGVLARLACHAAQSGASAVAISPVHAMFSADPQRYSPYSPSSRLFLNTSYIEPSIVLGELAVRQAVSEQGLRCPDSAVLPGGHIDWPAVLPRRLALLGQLFEHFRRHGSANLVQNFTAFRQRGGEALESHARYEALHAHYLAALGPASGWQDWPAKLHDPIGQGVKAYAAQHGVEIDFHVFLQWLADGGMQYAQHSARAAGMPIGLIADLAIGTDPRGSHAWSRQAEMLAGVTVGAPPDIYQSHGQNWGLTAFSPRALRQTAYGAFLETLRAVLTHAGGVRIDHILGLARMWLIPPGASAADGVYLRYPQTDMMRLLALEAWRHKAIVIGENLGTVPAGFNDALEQEGILGTSVLWFERSPETMPESANGPGFLPPARWPPHAVATTTTHDLPTIAGWWAGRDLEWQERLGQVSGGGALLQIDERRHAKTALWHALLDAGCVSDGGESLPRAAPRVAVLAFVSSTPAPLVIIPLEDLLGLVEQPNLPGSPIEGELGHPNWVQSLPVGVDDIFTHTDAMLGVAAIKRARGQA